MDFVNFRTNFLLKFSKNINNYDKLLMFIDSLSYSNKKIVFENLEKLKCLSEKKDNIVLEYDSKQSFSVWKENVIFVFELETYWQKFADYILKEFKKYLDSYLNLLKKNKDLEEELQEKNKKITELNEFIRVNDIHNKINKHNKTVQSLNEIKHHYEKKGNQSLIELFNMENQILDLTSLLDKDKKYMYKYSESMELLEMKKKELEEVRLKLNQDIEEKKIKISQMSLDNHELKLKNIEHENTIEELNQQVKNTKNEYIDFLTQIKILKETIDERQEELEMMQNEIETWMTELYKTRIAHYNAEQSISALEFRLQTIQKR